MKQFVTSPFHFLLSICLLVSSGCWREVHYVPKAPSAEEPAVAVTDNAAEESPATEGSADSFPRPEPVEVATEELFAAATASAPAVEEPTVAATEAPAEPIETDDLFGTDEPTAKPAAENAPLVPSPDALAVWRMASRWSLAAAVYAKSPTTDRHGELLKEAERSAETLGETLPELPTSADHNHEKAMIDYLLTTGTASLTARLTEKYSSQYAALATLAAKTNALLLVYTPKSQQLGPLIAELQQAAEDSGMPEELWSNLVTMLEQRAPFVDVKQEILAFHAAVSDYLASGQ